MTFTPNWPEVDAAEYVRVFGARPAVVARAPGRVNLIGEHTDYNEGFVLPFAIDRAVHVAAGTGAKAQLRVNSAALGETVTSPLEVCGPAAEPSFANYIRGVAYGLRRLGMPLEGANLWIGGDLPSGCGLSSSAALSVACATALAGLSHTELDPIDLVMVAQQAERDFAGTPCGVMDPYVSVFARAGNLLLLDCRAVAHRFVELRLPGCSLVVIHSGVRRELAGEAYGRRVQECESAVTKLAAGDPSIHALRDVSLDTLNRAAARLSPVQLRRARHVVTENKRVQAAVEALDQADSDELGRLLFDSHDSLRDDYEVSCGAIEELMNIVRPSNGVLGARMIGGGFGGCILVLVRSGAVDPMLAKVHREYDPRHESPSRAFVVQPSDGARCLRL
ncbi:MAG: galactokinase [Planctomycetota bacterium]